MACIAQHSDDDEWYYRTQVVKLIDDKTIKVRFSDFRYEELIPIHSIKVIDDEFLTLPSQAYHCELSGLKADVIWTPKDITWFTAVTEGIESLSGFFVELDDNGMYKVMTTWIP